MFPPGRTHGEWNRMWIVGYPDSFGRFEPSRTPGMGSERGCHWGGLLFEHEFAWRASGSKLFANS